MTVLFQGTEVEDFAAVTGFINSTAAGTFNSSNARASSSYTASAATTEFQYYLRSQAFSSTEFWTGFCIYATNASIVASLKWFSIGSGGTRRIALGQSTATSGILRAFQWNGSSWDTTETGAAGTWNPSLALRIRFDVYVKLGNPGALRVYKEGVPIIATTPDYSFGGISNFDLVEFHSASTGASQITAISEVIGATWNTIGSKLVTRIPDANGNYTAWTGAGFGSLDEAVAAADFMTSGVADQRMSFLTTDFPALTGAEAIENVRLTTLANRDAAGPQSMNHFVRISSLDYDNSNKTLAVAPAGFSDDLPVNPNTTAAWTVAGLNGTEFGVRSRA